ncbi:MAG: hypothetical protein IJL83_08060 [Clostridia bacterium]|nr:hypothetical protein [Clostridia bacterium]
MQKLYKKVKDSYPLFDEQLQGIGVDIEKPFETIPIEYEEGVVQYTGVQYVVFGDRNIFVPLSTGDVCISVTDNHHATDDIQAAHFIIEAAPLYLPFE